MGRRQKRITIFSWGYYGWGNATKQLVRAVDAVERSRGFEPPVFVDVRIRRSVRAIGFDGSNFEKLLGTDRYRWMKSLGNKQIVTRRGPRIQIANPSAASDLLEMAVREAKENRRIIFFCGCEFPKQEGKITCHRWTVGTLLLKAARRQGIDIEVIEWPGGAPGRIEVPLSRKNFASVERGRMTIPLGRRPALEEVAGLAWGSVATACCGSEQIHRIVGPAVYQKEQWHLPVAWFFYDSELKRAAYERKAPLLRRSCGLEARVS